MTKVKIDIPYGHSYINCNVANDNLKAIPSMKENLTNKSRTEEDIVIESFENPIESKKLADISKGKKNAIVITNDHTRAMRSMVTLPLILKEIRKNNPEIDIKILIATGLHRPTTEEEMRSMFGDEIVDNEEIIVHDAFDDSMIVDAGVLPSGARLRINKLVMETDLLVTEGFIEPHFFAGFSGGRKSIMPGVCSYKTVVANHSYKFINNPNAKSGELDKNPINIDLIEASRIVGVDYTLNVVLDKNKKIEAAFSGDIIKSHRVGCDYVMEQCKIEPVKGDIVITGNGGYPLDQNLYQTPKAVNTAVACSNKDAIIIMCAECSDQIGGEEFEKLMLMGTPKEIDEYLSKIDPEDTIPEQWCAQIYSKILMKHKVILVTEGIEKELVEKMNFLHSKTIDEALDIAYREKGKDASVIVIPDGVRVIA